MSTTPVPDQSYNANRLAFAIASFVLGGGLIAAVVAFTIVPLSELATWALMVLLPILAIAMGVGLISKSTWTMLRAATQDSNFGQRVRHWVDTLEKDPQATPASNVDQSMYA